METKVYYIDVYHNEYDENDWPTSWSDERFIAEAEKQGNIVSLSRFQWLFNDEGFSMENVIIRFITE